MVTKLTSVKTIIAKLISDLGITEDKLKISDVIEWAGEAIEKIGAVTQLVPKVKEVEIIGHQAPLPCDLHQLHQVAYSFNCNGPWISMRKATGSFAVWGDNKCNKNCACDENHKGYCCSHHGDSCSCCCPEMIIQDDILVNLAVDMIGNIDKTEALEMINSNANMRTILTNLINAGTVNLDYLNNASSANPSTDLQYTIKPGWIMCNAPCGYLKLSYSAIPTDEDGYVMIPDMTSFTEAIYWYITKKMFYIKWYNGSISRDIYYDACNNWNFYRNQAYAEALMPNEDGMESIKNAWNKIVPEFRDHSTFYSHTGERQVIYNHTR